jgi:hypothetical protein
MMNFKRSNILLSAFFSLLGLLWPQSAHGQNTVVNLQTVYTTFSTTPGTPGVFTCNGNPQPYFPQNLGQVAHQVSVFSQNATTLTVEIDGSDGLSQYRMSNPATSFFIGGGTNYVAIGSGTYSKLIVFVQCNAGATYSLSYSGAQTGFQSVNIGPPGGTPVTVNGGVSSQVQGIVTQQQSGGAVNPIIDGALQLPVNANFLTAGIDNFNVAADNLPAGSAGTFTIDTVPTPTASGEFAVAFESSLSDLTSTNIVSPWTCAPALPGSCGGGSPQMSMAFLPNVSAGQKFQRSFVNSTPAGQDIAAIVLFSSSTTSLRQSALASGVTAVAYSSNTLANSTKIAALRCAGTTPCVVSGVTDTQGGTWSQVTGLIFMFGLRKRFRRPPPIRLRSRFPAALRPG